MQRVIDTPFGEIAFELEYKNVKNVNLRVVQGGAVKVSAPRRIPYSTVEGFVRQKAEFISRAVARLSSASYADPEPEYNDGDTVRIFGREHRVRLCEGRKSQAALAGEELTVQMKNIADTDARRRCVQKFLSELLLIAVKAETDRIYPFFAARGIA